MEQDDGFDGLLDGEDQAKDGDNGEDGGLEFEGTNGSDVEVAWREKWGKQLEALEGKSSERPTDRDDANEEFTSTSWPDEGEDMGIGEVRVYIDTGRIESWLMGYYLGDYRSIGSARALVTINAKELPREMRQEWQQLKYHRSNNKRRLEDGIFEPDPESGDPAAALLDEDAAAPAPPSKRTRSSHTETPTQQHNTHAHTHTTTNTPPPSSAANGWASSSGHANGGTHTHTTQPHTQTQSQRPSTAKPRAQGRAPAAFSSASGSRTSPATTRTNTPPHTDTLPHTHTHTRVQHARPPPPSTSPPEGHTHTQTHSGVSDTHTQPLSGTHAHTAHTDVHTDMASHAQQTGVDGQAQTAQERDRGDVLRTLVKLVMPRVAQVRKEGRPDADKYKRAVQWLLKERQSKTSGPNIALMDFVDGLVLPPWGCLDLDNQEDRQTMVELFLEFMEDGTFAQQTAAAAAR